jgi:hypothetical protein
LEGKLYRRAEVPDSVDANKSTLQSKPAAARDLNAIEIKGSPQIYRVKM